MVAPSSAAPAHCRTRRRARLLAPTALSALLAAALLAACGATKTVSPTDAATLVSRLASPKPSSVHCPGGVAAKVGNTISCQVGYDNGDRGRVVVTVEATHGSRATLRIAGAGALRIETIGAKAAENYLRANILSNTGSTSQIGSISCANDTPDVVGHTIPCQVFFRDGHRYRVTVHVANTRGGVFAGRADVHPMG
jgi:hypothetical protein